MSDVLDLNEVVAHKVLGRGALGTVFLASHHPTLPSESPTSSSFRSTVPFALKIVDKKTLESKLDAARRSKWEMDVLSRLNHPFLPCLLATLDDAHGVVDGLFGWAIPFCPGGDLNVLRLRQPERVFSIPVIRFYLAEIVLALEHLHSLRIVYRDLKPENVLIQASGHVLLTDFDLSKMLSLLSSSFDSPKDDRKKEQGQKCGEQSKKTKHKKKKGHHRSLTRLVAVASVKVMPFSMGASGRRRSAAVSRSPATVSTVEGVQRTNSFVGTEEYVAPEVVRGNGHALAVDWWALGVLVYEMLYGKTPFRGSTRKETFLNIMTRSPQFFGPGTGSAASLQNLISGLLEKDPERRLGAGGAADIKRHEFFYGLDWDGILDVLRPPFIMEETSGLDEEIDIREFFRQRDGPNGTPKVVSRSTSSPDHLSAVS